MEEWSTTQPPQPVRQARIPWWRRLLGEARTRILVWYVALMALSSLVSVFGIRHVLFIRLEERVERSLTQEVEEFRKLIDGNDPETGKPFGDDVSAIFDVFLDRNIPEDGEFLLALVDGELYKASPIALPAPLQAGSPLIEEWSRVTRPTAGSEMTASGLLLYRVEPLHIRYRVEPLENPSQGIFVVVYITTGERQEVNEAVWAVAQVTLVVLILASVLAWFAAGKVLAPLRLLVETAHSIQESDLTQRIPVQGEGEIADLAITFNDMMDRIQATFKSQREFLNDAGHELRTPITIIRGHLELMGSDPEEQRETLDLVLDELDRMSRFIDELILLAKAERPDFLQLETVAIAALTEELYAKAQALADRQWRLEQKGVGQIVADRQRITEAIMNLAENATQHTQTGDVIALGSSLRNGKVRFWVRDTGEGIALADQQRIFERFVRAPSQYSRSEGTGLGLSLVRAIATAHGGRVELSSQPGLGSTFTLVLPPEPDQEMHG